MCIKKCHQVRENIVHNKLFHCTLKQNSCFNMVLQKKTSSHFKSYFYNIHLSRICCLFFISLDIQIVNYDVVSLKFKQQTTIQHKIIHLVDSTLFKTN